MKKIIVSIIVIGLLLTTSLASGNAFEKGELPGQSQPAKPPIPYADIYVDDDSEPDGDGSYEHPFQNIQDGVDASEDGDIVYVFNGIYKENLYVNKSIVLKGEDRENTVIDGNFQGDTIWINASSISMQSFKVINSWRNSWSHGIFVRYRKRGKPVEILKNISISDCILENNQGGIRIDNVDSAIISYCVVKDNSWASITNYNGDNVKISHCDVYDNGGNGCYGGIYVCNNPDYGDGSSNVEISYCDITNNYPEGVRIGIDSSNVKVHHNFISMNTGTGITIDKVIEEIVINNNVISENGNADWYNSGILMQNCYNCVTIKHNIISSNNKDGVLLLRSSGNKILENNFINNKRSARFEYKSGDSNTWYGNYWDRPRLLPKLIVGLMETESGDIPWVEFDGHPAKEPYDI